MQQLREQVKEEIREELRKEMGLDGISNSRNVPESVNQESDFQHVP